MLHFVGKINTDIYKCITEDITTDEVVMTDERIEHIRQRHPDHYERIEPFLAVALAQPDYILRDTAAERSATGLILKQVENDGMRMQVVLRIHTSQDEQDYKNSVISAWVISESRWNNYLRHKEILYKAE